MIFEHLAIGPSINFNIAHPEVLHLVHHVFGLVSQRYPKRIASNESALDFATYCLSKLNGIPEQSIPEIAQLLAHEIELARARLSAFAIPVRQLQAQGRGDVGALQAALWFLVELEPSEEEQADACLRRKHAFKVEMASKDVRAAEAVVDLFARSLVDKSAAGMNAAYYGITNSSWWLDKGPVAISVAGNVMNHI